MDEETVLEEVAVIDEAPAEEPAREAAAGEEAPVEEVADVGPPWKTPHEYVDNNGWCATCGRSAGYACHAVETVETAEN